MSIHINGFIVELMGINICYQIDVYLANGELYEGQIMGHDFHYNLAEVSIKSRNFLKPAIIGNIDEQVVDPLGGSRSF